MRESGADSWSDGTPSSARPGPTEDVAVAAALDRAFFVDNPDLVWDLETDGTIRRANARLTEVLGYAPDAVRGRPLTDLQVPGDDVTARALAEARTGRATSCISRMRHRDDHVVIMRVAVMPLIVDGSVVRLFANAQDVTAAMDAEQNSREQQALYRLLVEQLPECVVIYSEGRYAFINPAGAAMRGPGYTPADVMGRRWTDFVDPVDQDAYGVMLASLAAAPEGTARVHENRFLWPDGRRVEVEGSAVAVRLHGRPAVHCFARDVTEYRRLDAERLRAQRMEALGRLAAGVAHDFNNLLAVMLMAVESVAAAVPDDDPLREDLADAADAARRGRALTRQLLTFAKRDTLRPTTFALNDVVQGIADLLRRVAGSDVRLSVELAPDAGTITADPSQVEQALLNLVTNARDAMPSGGMVLVETGRLDGDVRLTVRDTGEGIAPDARPHLFEPFFTTKRDGYGLGLATVYGVVTGVGGRVDVESAPGEGTAFHLYFPRATP